MAPAHQMTSHRAPSHQIPSSTSSAPIRHFPVPSPHHVLTSLPSNNFPPCSQPSNPVVNVLRAHQTLFRAFSPSRVDFPPIKRLPTALPAIKPRRQRPPRPPNTFPRIYSYQMLPHAPPQPSDIVRIVLHSDQTLSNTPSYIEI
ncbi:hypothetical protein Hypma_005888 [Hypsizygus marmoreus]|uniref:Uncharacterized protein n=1 Tax=Hypsizygus marmoreus TaxID=39966 RepID=A0A369K7Y5_HYPMA|nr:hypothetical protein Hypma_005884 [Hypsizygus marmoreus]RDB30737.1 hypothetical protein Hypma_005888 [Hypsizygus marmoreus]